MNHWVADRQAEAKRKGIIPTKYEGPDAAFLIEESFELRRICDIPDGWECASCFHDGLTTLDIRKAHDEWRNSVVYVFCREIEWQ